MSHQLPNLEQEILELDKLLTLEQRERRETVASERAQRADDIEQRAREASVAADAARMEAADRSQQAQEILGRLQADSGWPEQDLLYELGRSNVWAKVRDWVAGSPSDDVYWGPDRTRSYMQFCGETVEALRSTNWRALVAERRALVDVQLHEAVVRATRSACEALPPAADLSSEERLRLMDPRLRAVAESADVSIGGVLAGNTGTGKSLAIVEIMYQSFQREALEQADKQARSQHCVSRPRLKGLLFVSAEDIAGCIAYGLADEGTRPERHGDWVSETGNALYRAKRARWVALDDLGWEPAVGRPALRALIRHRYNYGMPTMITTGWTLEAIDAEYGDATVRRFVECRGKRGPVVEVR